MTQNELDHLFTSARTAPSTTSVDDVAVWVGTAAVATTGVLGIAAKLKLFIAKKSLIMLGSIIGAAGVVGVTAALLGPGPSEEKPTNMATPIVEESDMETSSEPVFFAEVEDTNEIIEPPVIAPPVVPEVITVAPLGVEPIVVDVRPMAPVFVAPPQSPEPHIGVAPVVVTKDKRKTVKGSGNVVTETREIKPFKKLVIDGVIDVIITQGDKESVKVEADDNLIQYIEVNNSGESLVLSTGKVNMKKPTKLNVYVTVKNLIQISNSGVGDVTSTNQLNGKKLVLDLSGVGDVALDINYSNLHLNYSGVGDIVLKGDTDHLSATSSGVGDIVTYELKAEDVHLDHSGVGDALVFADDKISVHFSGVGDVQYKGDPEQKDIHKSGIGSVKAK